MFCTARAAALLLLPFLALGAQAQTYQIKVKDFGDVGKKVNVQIKDEAKQAVKISVMGMVVKEENKEEIKVESYTDVVLEPGEANPKKIERTYTSAKTTKDGKESTTAYHGLTLIFEMQNGKYKVRVKGGAELPEADVTQLEKQANDKLALRTEKLLPEKAVAVGDSWKIDPNLIAKALGEGTVVDASKSEAKGKLVKAYKKNGRQYGVIDYEFKLAMADLNGLKLPTPLFFNFNLSVDTAIDGSTTEGTMRVTAALQGKTEVQQNGQTIAIDLNVGAKGSQVQSGEQ